MTQGYRPKTWVSRMVLNLGVARVVALVTLVSVMFSDILAFVLAGALKGGMDSLDVVFATTIPALIAPPVTFVFIRLVHQLEMAEQRLWLLVTQDELSGVATRRHFMDLAQREWERALRSGGRLSLLMVDVDHFKRINDTCGHAQGDQVLRELGQIFREVCRRVDVVGRLGGEEFMLLMPDTALDEAVLVAERLRGVVESELARRSGLTLPVTASVGVASVMVNAGKSFASLMEQADTALYQAKASGRNCVMAFLCADRS